MSSIDQQFIEYVVKALVSNPDEVIVERRIDEKGVLLELTVDPEDLGRVIGKRGATAQSLRTLLRALGTKNDARYNLKIVDNGVAADGDGAAASDDNDDSDVDNATKSQAQAVPKPAELPSDDMEARSVDEDFLVKPDDYTAPVRRDEDEGSSRASRTRRELAELDDLDV